MVVPDQADVVVVGGGPAGASTAAHLARAGRHVVLLDQASFPREKACAEYCSPGIVDALERLGALDLVLEQEHRGLDRMRVVAAEQELPLDFSGDRPGVYPALGIRRSLLDDALLRYAVRCGAEVHQRTRVTGPVLDGELVTGVEYRQGNDVRTLRAGFVVAADGLHSRFARSLGLNLPVRWPNRLGLVSRYSDLGADLASGQMHIGDGVYSGVTPVGDREALVSLVVPMGTNHAGISTTDFYERSLRRLPEIARILHGASRVDKVRGIGPLGKRVRRRSGPGFLLVGDAAGFFDPLTGEGIHRALTGGEIAADAVLTALERPDRLPVGYEEARARLFTDKERVCWIIQAMTTSPRMLRYAVARTSKRGPVNRTLRGVLGDYAPAGGAFRLSFLWNLLRP